MGVTLSAIWSQVEKLIVDGISVIPVRDKHDPESGRAAKTPFGSWKKYQDKALTKDELWHLMDYHNTEAVGTVCGKVSGNLEVIDIDVKFKLGIDAILFQDIKTLYPELFEKLRIHKSPSGGYHILYRISENVVPGNLKLAGRMATEEELLKDPKNKTYNFFETRGEGGYVLAPPSMGYSVHQENPIPVLTWEERCSLITLCETYNEIIKVVPTYKSTKTESEYYTENPFDDFNHRCNPVEFFKKYGWEFFKQNNRFIWFTRPGKTTGVSASWNLEKNIFYIFTASTELEAAKGYYPSTILSELEFQGDKRKTYQHLVSNGYGKVKPSIEKSIVKKKAISREPLPANFSAQAKADFTIAVNTIIAKHPFGIFWNIDDKDKISIDREGLYDVAQGLGYRNFEGEIVQIVDIFVHKRSTRYFFDEIKAYINEEDGDFHKDICNTYESFLQTSGKFTIERLPIFEEVDVICDSADKAYKFFKNGFVEISEASITLHSYDLIPDKLVWQDKVMNRDWAPEKPAYNLYEEYLKNATGLTDYAKKIIGYLSHDYKSESAGYIIVLTETVPDPKDGGGSGKNVFGNMLRNTTSVCTVPGSMVQFNERFFQPWNGQRIYFLADIPKKIDWLFLKEMATGSGLLKKLYKDETEIAIENMCKLVLNSNYSYDDADGGLKRRIIALEFSNFYTVNGGIDNVHGKMFPGGFDADDWAGFDHCIAESIQLLLKDKGKLTPGELSRTGWEKKFKGQFGESTYDFIEENIGEWVTKEYVTTKAFKDLYHAFCEDNDINIKFRAGQKLMNNAIKEYCLKHGHYFNAKGQIRINSINHKAKVFKSDLADTEDIPEINNIQDDDEIPF
jgi:hypothetical protein